MYPPVIITEMNAPEKTVIKTTLDQPRKTILPKATGRSPHVSSNSQVIINHNKHKANRKDMIPMLKYLPTASSPQKMVGRMAASNHFRQLLKMRILDRRPVFSFSLYRIITVTIIQNIAKTIQLNIAISLRQERLRIMFQFFLTNYSNRLLYT